MALVMRVSAPVAHRNAANAPDHRVPHASPHILREPLARHVPFRRSKQPRPCRFPAFSASSSAVAGATGTSGDTSTALGAAGWTDFATAASGEYSGMAVTYNSHFEAQEVPYQYVPDAFREWGQVPKDWHTQCSCLADADGMLTKLKWLMPIVGCEADAVAYNEDSRRALQSEPQHQHEPKTVLPDGSYSTGPRVLRELTTARIEHCLADGSSQRRTRLVFNLKRGDSGDAWRLATLEQHVEARERDYDGGVELAACGYAMSPITETPLLEAAVLEGRWRVASAAAFVLDEKDTLCVSEAAAPDTVKIPADRVLLHSGAWCAFSSGDAGEATLTAGWLISEQECRVVSRTFSDDRMTGMTFLTASKQP